MDLYFLLKRTYPPYYKWTFRALKELDEEGLFSSKIQELAETVIRPDAWNGTGYHPNRPNFKDSIICLAEEIASLIEELLIEQQLTTIRSRYLEIHVNEVLNG